MLDEMAAKDPAKYKSFVEQQLREGVESGVTNGIYIVPEPGLVLKMRTVSGRKLFVNLCAHDKIDTPGPQLPSGGGGADEDAALRFPMCMGEVRKAAAKDGEQECDVWDVVLNPAAISMAAQANSPAAFAIAEIIAQSFESKHKVAITRGQEWFVMLKRKRYFDPPVRSQYIQDRKKDAQNEILTSDVKADERQGERLLSAVTSTKRTSEARASQPSSMAKPKAVIDVRTDPRTGLPVKLHIVLHMPLMRSAERLELTLDYDTDRLLVRLPDVYALDLDLPFQVSLDDDANAHAKFLVPKAELVLELPVVGVL